MWLTLGDGEVVDVKALYLPADLAFLRYIEIPGDDPPLLWLHGWQCSSTGELLPAAVQPPLRGRRSLLVDFLGHGYSDKPIDFAYTVEEHARTVVALIDGLGVTDCGLVGHSMGGRVAVHAADARPAVVSLLVLAEASIDPDDSDNFAAEPEDDYVERVLPELLEAQSQEAQANPGGLRAAHVEMTRLIEPRAIYRERVSMDTGVSVRPHLRRLQMPKWYLNGELSGDEDGHEADLASLGIGWKVVPGTGHPMGLQNPAGFAHTIAEVLSVSWAG